MRSFFDGFAYPERSPERSHCTSQTWAKKEHVLQVVMSCNIAVEACWSLVDVTLMSYNDVTQGCHLFYFEGTLVIKSLKIFFTLFVNGSKNA